MHAYTYDYIHHVYIMSSPPGGRATLACPTLRCGPVPMHVTESVLFPPETLDDQWFQHISNHILYTCISYIYIYIYVYIYICT